MIWIRMAECGFTILLIDERNRKWVSQKIQPANFLGIYKLLGNGVRIYLENQVAAFNTSKISEYCWIEIIKQKMKEILTNLGCLWGGRGPVLQPHPLRNSAETAISAILTILGSLWGEVEVLLLLDTSFGDRPPSHWWWRNCRISDEYFWRSGIPRKSDEYF